MESESALLVSGTMLLAISALLGFVQYRHRECPDAFARWKTGHVGDWNRLLSVVWNTATGLQARSVVRRTFAARYRCWWRGSPVGVRSDEWWQRPSGAAG